MEHAVDVLMSVWDKPIFQLMQGIVIGAAVIGALWAICAAYRYSKEIKLLEAENGLDLTTVTIDRTNTRVFVNGKEIFPEEDEEGDDECEQMGVQP